jgi:hypothetical protein
LKLSVIGRTPDTRHQSSVIGHRSSDIGHRSSVIRHRATALDIAYIAGGLYLKERGLRIDKDKFVGFGKSIILQGAFLLTFDAVMYTFHHTHAKELPQIVNQISLGPTGFNIRIPLGSDH